MLRLNLIPTAAANKGTKIPQIIFLLIKGINNNISKDSLNIFIKNIEIKKLAMLEYTSDRKRMIVVVRNELVNCLV